ncbi:cell filamentation protein Fic [bacterium E08(2017)]|nr:cell filamentation protein Fic [bacterium E08(2017)]
MKSLTTEFLDKLNLTTEQASTLVKIGEYRGKQELFTQQTPEALETLKQTAIIESSECSNRLEGITAPHKRIEALVRQTTQPQDRSEQEIAGYRDALNLIHETAKYMNCSVNVCLQLHTMMYKYLPQDGGRWKMKDNEIIQKMSDGSERVRFKAVTAVETPQAMEAMVSNYSSAIENHEQEPLLIIPLAILDFLCIHPFTDGNGRVSRLLTLMMLYHFGYEVGRYISLERIFEESKETYYETLETSSQGWHEAKHDVHPWLNYFWGVLIRAYREFEERVGSIASGRGSKTALIMAAVERRIGPFAISDIDADCPGISRDMIRVVLRQMRDNGVLRTEGHGRGAKWFKEEL